MKLELRRGDLAAQRAGAIALGILERGGPLGGAARAVDRATRGAIQAVLDSGDFKGRHLETVVVYPKHAGLKRVILVGLGPKPSLTAHRVRLAAAQAARRARELGSGTLAAVAFGAGAGGLDPAIAAKATAEGLVLGHYRFTAYRTNGGVKPLSRVLLFEPDAERARVLRAAADAGAAWARGACLARDLANTPGADLTPERLAERAREVARDAGAKLAVLDVPAMERLGMNGVLAVGRGSPNPPRFLVLDRPAPKGVKDPETVVLVGKGITFDTGGISIKPRENMHKMKYDMSGAAAVLGTFAALPALDPRCRVVGLVASAENMPDGAAFKPGDVLRMMDGTTVEITNTDAEGRLVLADALTYARRFEPAAVVDLATLTGAMSIALGNQAAGVFSDHDDLAGALVAAGEEAGERLWRMPLWDTYAAELKSDTADLVNSGAREGGSIIAAVFLKRFAKDLPWAHLDIAPTAWSGADRPHETRGATGYGVRLLLEWLSRRSPSSPAAP